MENYWEVSTPCVNILPQELSLIRSSTIQENSLQRTLSLSKILFQIKLLLDYLVKGKRVNNTNMHKDCLRISEKKNIPSTWVRENSLKDFLWEKSIFDWYWFN